ncbi:enoyl-CoA hydratase-related protein [Thermoflavimicrobium dichotomicum]|uniref:Probable enoyl-CoA hydratase echA8 n=1 Tax=Thermoflavimicrobium dichotomicum TaxID=46223 RepID=A0A1I3V2H5_9BACL|nr:enoyl-CoA hydratase-related protein [Thermoflavimicrobium dichotomicum]SFJ89638.1 enoyl-CoA hydratase [Thermoflavimicrobium dichotomicum]
MTEPLVLVEKLDHVARIQLNRPHVLNALNMQLIRQLVEVLEECDQDEQIRVMIITGNEKAFAAGADIKEMVDASPVDLMVKRYLSDWLRIRQISKPLIAAVSGFALGGGCELAMCCDLIIASESARFGQPEINIGVMPGAGGTQRLTRAVGKVKAMEMILTGKSITAQEALDYGLVNRVVPVEDLDKEALALAQEIASKPPLAVRLAKQSILKALDLSLEDGLHFEQNNFCMLFATEDQREGMQAFVEKRKPTFRGR